MDTVGFKGEEYYIPNGSFPRPYHRGFWSAFGHVAIDGIFSGAVQRSCSYGGAIFARYVAEYQIEDEYQWFEDKTTPFHFPFAHGTLWIPHQWELSLESATPPRAHSYTFSISWTESNFIIISQNFGGFRELEEWELGLVPLALLTN